MWPARVLAVIALAAGLTACGSSPSPTDQVRAKVQQFATATAHQDAKTLCEQVLAPALVSRITAAGLSCDQAMKVFVSSVSHPTIRISKVSVHGSTASAVVLAGASGQTSALESVGLARTKLGWRLTSLAAPR